MPGNSVQRQHSAKGRGVGLVSPIYEECLRWTNIAFVWNTSYSSDLGVTTLTSSTPPLFSIDPVWEVVQVADWNADGMPDLVFRNTATGLVFVWYLNGTTLGASAFITQIDPSWEIVPRR